MQHLILRFIATVLAALLSTPVDLPPCGAVQEQTRIDTPLLDYAVQVARSYENNRSYLLGELAVRYASLGEFDRALELANSIDTEEERDVTKATVATSLNRSGNSARAREIMNSIQLFIETGGAKVPRYKSFMAGQIAEEFAACGAFDRVFELALITDDAYLISTSLNAVLDNFVSNEQNRTDLSILSKVIKVSARLKDGDDRTLLMRIAEKYAEAGEYEKAIGLAESLMEKGKDAVNFERDQAIQNIALILAKRGKFACAIKLAESTDDYFKLKALTQIAKEQIATAEKEDGLKLLGNVTSPFLKEPYHEDDFDDAGLGARRLAAVAIIHAGAGDRDQAEGLLAIALKRAMRVRKRTERDTALREVAVAYAEAGMFEQAAGAAQPNNFTYFKIDPLAQVAVVMLRQKRNREVQQVVKMIQDASVEDGPESNADGLVKIASEYIAMGDKKSALEILTAAFDIAPNAPVNEFQPIMMRNLAVTFAEAGDYTKAMKVAGEIKSTFYRVLALADIGVLQAKAV